MKKQPRVLIVGSINMDMIFYGAHGDEMKRNECTVFESVGYFCGGKGANQAVAASKIGAEVYLVSAVGNDEAGDKIIAQLKESGIHTDFVKVLSKVQTGLSTIFMMRDSSYIGMNIRGANNSITPSMVEYALNSMRFDMVMMQLEMPLETVYCTYEYAAKKRIPVILDAGPAMSIPLERLSGIFMISPNEAETAALTGVAVTDEDTASQAAKILKEKSKAEYILLKLGGMGSYFYDGKAGMYYPACEVPFVDTTGAGDTFTASLMIQLCQNRTMKEAISYATVAAGICVSRKGGLASIPTKEEIEIQQKKCLKEGESE